jgi:hypothetical protein
MIRFYGRSRDTFKMPNKSINEGYKAIYLADRGYIFDFRMPSRSRTTLGVKNIAGLNQTSILVYNLTMSLLYDHYSFNIYMDNFFSNVPLFLKLRKIGIGAYRTVR